MKQARIHGPEWTKLSYVNMQMDMHSVGTPSFVESYTMWSNVYNWRATTTGIVSIYSGSESFLTSFKISQHEQNEAYVSTQGLANTKLANTKRDTHTERRTQRATYKATQRATRTKRHPRSDTNSDTASVTQSSDTRAFRARLAPLLTLWNLNSTISSKGSRKNVPLPGLLTLCHVRAALPMQFVKSAPSSRHKVLRLPRERQTPRPASQNATNLLRARHPKDAFLSTAHRRGLATWLRACRERLRTVTNTKTTRLQPRDLQS